jgi:hypothetical protein
MAHARQPRPPRLGNQLDVRVPDPGDRSQAERRESAPGPFHPFEPYIREHLPEDRIVRARTSDSSGNSAAGDLPPPLQAELSKRRCAIHPFAFRNPTTKRPLGEGLGRNQLHPDQGSASLDNHVRCDPRWKPICASRIKPIQTGVRDGSPTEKATPGWRVGSLYGESRGFR